MTTVMINPSTKTVLAAVMALLESAQAVTVDGGTMLTGWDVDALTGDEGNQVVQFRWTDGEHDFMCRLDEGGIENGSFGPDGAFTCQDSEDETTVIRMFGLTSLKPADQDAEVLPGATKEEIGSVMMQDVVGDYEVPADVPEWKWVEREASFNHARNGQNGIWEFVLNLSCTFDNVPEKLKPVFKKARGDNLAYLIFHQGT